MNTKSLLIGIISFMAGGLLVSIVATTIEKPVASSDSMQSMTESLTNKRGDEFDEEFINSMIAHHEGAVGMAKLAEGQAKHEEIKELSRNIITAQEQEIAQMKQWQSDWGYEADVTQDSHE
ncbi:DUF305 domain-containing protein [Candidatus Saccharibacteria bacterium]|nr:DUF305 domain-containing protein [Candidatus Saccharibacteria bacterium]